MSDRPRRRALIVAVSDYRDDQLRRLRSPAQEATRLARVLHDPDIGNFDVEVSSNEEERDLRRRIADFFARGEQEDLLLIHFSCHGVKDPSGELHLAATDTRMGHLLGATSIPASWLRSQIERSRSKRIVVFLDCCFSGSFPGGIDRRAGREIDLGHHLEGYGRIVITASNAMEYAFEGEQLSGEPHPSIFTGAILHGLETGEAAGKSGWVSVDDLYAYVYDRVREQTPTQTPQKMGTVEGKLVIARRAHADEHVEPQVERERSDSATARTAPAVDDVELLPVPTTVPVPPTSSSVVRNRLLAWLLDCTIAVPLGLVLATLVWLAFRGSPLHSTTAWTLTACALGGMGYSVICSLRYGRTAGKDVRGLKVVTIDGTEPMARQLLVREGVKWIFVVGFGIATFGALLIVVVVLAEVRPDKRLVHDALADTMVVADGRVTPLRLPRRFQLRHR